VKYQKPAKKRLTHLAKRRKNGLGASAKGVLGLARREKRPILPSGVYYSERDTFRYYRL
jgi:hypothetical protein